MTTVKPVARFRSDAAWSAAGTVLPGVLGALVVPLLLQRLQPANFAVFAFCLVVISFAPNFDLGVSRTALRRMAALQNATDGKKAALVYHCLRRSWLVGTASGLCLVGIALLLHLSSHPLALRWQTAAGPLAVAALGLPVAIVANTQRSLLEGVRQFSASAGVRIALGVLTVVVPLLLTWVTREVWLLCAALVALRAVALLHQARLLSQLGLVRQPDRPSTGGDRGQFWRESLWYAALGLLGLWMSGFDRFVIAWLGEVDAATLAVLLAPQEAALRAITLPAALVPALMVRMAMRTGPQAGTGQLVARLFWMVGAAVFVICAAVSAATPGWAPRVFSGVDPHVVTLVTQVLLIGVFSNAVAQFAFANILARGYVKDVTLCHAAELPLFLLAVLILVDRHGMVGAAACWSGRIVLDTALVLWRSDRRVPSLSVRHWQWAHLLAVAALVAIPGLAAWA